ncbi:subtilisin-like protein [Xylariomycetidae sp. FL0641]|nr:subtilisin-like protein [Xylariomycetidae sp. FL0641]
MLVRSLLLALAAGLSLEALAGPVTRDTSLRKRVVPSTHNVHERHAPNWGRKWTKRTRVQRSFVLPMRIGLKQSNLDAGHERLMDISNPESANYGKHMTSEEVIDFFAPQQSSIDAVTDWLTSSGISKDRIGLSVNKQWIQFDATAGEVEELLFADFHVWQHQDGSFDISTEAYHMPATVQEHVDYVTPGTRLRNKRQAGKTTMMKKTKRETASGYKNDVKPFTTVLPSFPNPNSTTCSIYVTADCTRVQYNMPNGTSDFPGNELGVFESLDDHYSKADLDVFFPTLYPYLNVPKGTYPEERLVDGAVGAVEEGTHSKYPVELGLESSLDFDSAWPLIWPQKTVLYQVDDQYYEYNGTNGFWNTFLDAIDGSYCTSRAFGETGNCAVPACADPAYPDPHPGGYKGRLQCGVYAPTHVVSVSYGGDEAAWPSFYMRRQCAEWMKLSLQGTTVVMSSGDAGVGGAGECPVDAGGRPVFAPDYASTCPYVLSVGSTQWDRFATAPRPWEPLREVATARFPSGGGFSNVFARPAYQDAAVAAYLDAVAPALPFGAYAQFVDAGGFARVDLGGGRYNRLGRAYPDVAAVGDRQLVRAGGDWYLVGGTSLSAPVWGAVLTLVNEERLRAGKSTVGFVHPVLYAHPEVFNDVTQGSNEGCDTGGFVASEGWDPVSGLGSPNYPKLLKLLMSI